MAANSPKPPAELGISGATYWRNVHSRYEFDAKDTPFLLSMCRILDILDALQARLDADGVITEGTRGTLVAHPALGAMARQHATLDRLRIALGLPDEETGAKPLTPYQQRTKTANDARWRENRLRKAAQQQGA